MDVIGTRARSRVTSRLGAVLSAVGVLLAVSMGPTVASASAGSMQRLPGCTANHTMSAEFGGGRNDDGSSVTAFKMGFTLNFEGNDYSEVWINNNGNVTFGSSLSQFTPQSIGSLGVPIIAPFWADVDTRNAASAVTTWGTTTDEGHSAFCVEWDGVGYYNEHADKLNKFELILVSRPDRAPGDFDIVFNYDQIQWETGDASSGVNGFGGAAPRVGFGLAGGGSEELSGSGTNGAFLDNGPAALVATTENSSVPGRHVFPVINGEPQGEPGLHGLVTSHNAALVNAPVQACPEGGGPCHVTQTDGQGRYSFVGLPEGLYSITVNPPSGDRIDLPTTVGPDQVTGAAPVDQDVVMSTLTPPPAGTVIGGEGAFGSGQPILEWRASTPISTNGCPGATAASYEVVVPANSPSGTPRTIQTGPLSESPAGVYHGTIAPLYPFSGFAQIRITLECPAPSAPQIGSFDIYVDPSGHVVDTNGNPIAGATVTLLSSASPGGPFTPVPNGSAVMAPNNRNNPSITDAAGRFGWDVLAGFYEVTASKAGCTSATTGVLTVPPPIADLRLVLNCPQPVANAATIGGVKAVALRDGSIRVTFTTTGAGTATVNGTTRIKLAVKASRGRHHKKPKPRFKVLGYASGHTSATGPKTVTLTIAPNGGGKKELKRLKRLLVSLSVAFKPTSGTSTTKTASVTVRYYKPKPKPKHHGRHNGHK